MRTATVLLILPSLMLSACLPDLVVSRPVGVPFALPSHLRQCAEKLGYTDPATLKTVGPLLLGFGTEQGARLELEACHAEIVRLIDVHNAAMTSGRLATKGPPT